MWTLSPYVAILELVRNLGTSTLNLQKSQALETPKPRGKCTARVSQGEHLRRWESDSPKSSSSWLPGSKEYQRNCNIDPKITQKVGHPQIEIDLKSLWSIYIYVIICQLQRCNGFVESQDSMASVCTCLSQHSMVAVSVSVRLNWSYWTPFREATGNVIAQEKTCWKLLGMS